LPRPHQDKQPDQPLDSADETCLHEAHLLKRDGFPRTDTPRINARDVGQ